MNTIAAREILGLPQEASFAEARKRFRFLAKRFHPDNPSTGDATQFSLISSAYIILQSEAAGVTDASEDIEDILNLKTHLNEHFGEIQRDYENFRHRIKKETSENLHQQIYQCSSTDQLRQALETTVSRQLVDAKVKIERHLKNLYKANRSMEKSFLFELFGSMYRERRKYWFMTLYRNPLLLGQVIGIAAVYFVRNAVTLPEALSVLHDTAALPWLPLFIAGLGLIALGIQFILLNPKHQFVPPSMSLGGLQTTIRQHKNSVGTTAKEAAIGGTVGGALIGTLILPGLGTLIGAALGALFGLGGESLADIKSRIYTNLITEFDRCLVMIDEAVTLWISKTKTDLHKAAIISFSLNSKKIAGLIEGKKIPTRLLTDGKNRN